MAFMSKRLRDLLKKKRKPFKVNRDSFRVAEAINIQACNTCHGRETKSDTWREEFPILHEPWCKFYPSLANIELEARLEEQGHFLGSKWDDTPSYFSTKYKENIERTKAAVKESKAKAKRFWDTFATKGIEAARAEQETPLKGAAAK